MALGESELDVARLQSGNNVAIFKRDDTTWKFSPAGLAGIAEGISSDISSSVDGNLKSASTSSMSDSGITLSYKDYLRLFLLMVNGDTLAERTARLIELNVTNKREGIGQRGDRSAREAAMAGAELFDLAKAVTGFSVSTTVDLRMLFLSMPFAQKGTNGTVPPGKLQIRVTDYRGY